MAVTLLGTGTQVNSAASPVTGSFGSGQNATPGSLLVAVCTNASSASAGAFAQAAGTSGWTKVTEASSTQCKAAVFWKVRGASAEPAPAFASATGTRAGLAVTLFDLAGADTVTPVGTSGTATGTTGSPLTVTTSGTVPAAGCLAVSAHVNYRSTSATNAWTKDAAWTNATTNGSLTQYTHSASDRYLAPASGSTLACGGTWGSGTTYTAAVSVVFEPASGSSMSVQPAAAGGTGAGYDAVASVANGPGVGYTARPSAAIAVALAYTPDGPPRGVTVHAGTTSLRFRTLPGRGRPGRLALARSRTSAPPAGAAAALAAGFSNGEVTAGLFYPASGTGLAGGTGTWANPGNALADDGAAATWAVVLCRS